LQEGLQVRNVCYNLLEKSINIKSYIPQKGTQSAYMWHTWLWQVISQQKGPRLGFELFYLLFSKTENEN